MSGACAVWCAMALAAWGAGPKSEAPVRVDSVLITLVDQAEIPAQEAGVLAEVNFKEGQLVKEGELLARIEDGNAQIAKRRAKVEFDIASKEESNTIKVRYAKEALATAKTEYQRATASIEKYRKSVTASEIDQLRLAAEQAALELEQAEHDLAVSKLNTQLKQVELDFATRNVERRQILSPIGGMVVQLKRRHGEWVPAGECVFRVLRLDRLRAEGFVNSRDVTADFKGRPVTVRVDLPNQPKAEFIGKLVFISPEVNPVNGQIRVWAEFDNRDLLLRPGLTAEMTIEPGKSAGEPAKPTGTGKAAETVKKTEAGKKK